MIERIIQDMAHARGEYLANAQRAKMKQKEAEWRKMQAQTELEIHLRASKARQNG